MTTIKKKCDKCDGKLTRVCNLCKGTGKRVEKIHLTSGWNMENISICPLCHGYGKIVENCKALKNS